MNQLEELCEEMHQQGIEIFELSMTPNTKGLYCDNIVWLNRELDSSEKLCVLNEEFAHHLVTSGDILDLSDIRNQKQEKVARNLAVESLIPPQCFVRAAKEGIRNRYEFAEFLGVTEEFLDYAITHYREKYGLFIKWTSYLIYFEPLGVFELLDEE